MFWHFNQDPIITVLVHLAYSLKNEVTDQGFQTTAETCNEGKIKFFSYADGCLINVNKLKI